MTTIGTLLSGGECVGVGARAAGLQHLWGFELDDDIAGVARLNGFDVHTADVMSLDPATLEAPDVLHASPVCKRASQANQSAELNEDGTKEAPEDIAMGEKIASFIDVMTPRVVTIENVYAYRNFQAFKIICAALNRGGYMWDFDNLNSADFGVPQTRRRLILRAVRRALLPNLPQPVKWTGWYEAISDLIPTLPESRFADWQLARLPGELKTFLINGNGNTNFAEAYPGRGCLEPSIPAHTVVTINQDGGAYPRAFILDCQLAGNTTDRSVTLRQGDAPMFTITAGKDGRQPVRAWLVDQINHRGDNGQSTIKASDEPVWTIPVYSPKHPAPRAWLSAGRVVRMTPRALARFQSIPDSYILPDNNKLACTVIGNGVPCLLYRRIVEQLR